jgi:hypothetical protein
MIFHTAERPNPGAWPNYPPPVNLLDYTIGKRLMRYEIQKFLKSLHLLFNQQIVLI